MAANRGSSITGLFPADCLERFQPVRRLAAGGFGAVFLARQRQLDREVAIKLVHAQLLSNPEEIARFVNEARITASLSHPHIVTVIDHGAEAGVPWIAYELLPGPDLGSIVQGGPMEPKAALQAAAQVASALAEAHGKGILHRDIKPENVIQASPGLYKVTDFGIAKWSREGAVQTASGLIIGTPSTMAPEIILGEPASEGSDLYSLGMLLLHLILGRLPFPDLGPMELLEHRLKNDLAAPSRLEPGLPRLLDPLVLKALDRSPRRRFESARAMQVALEEAAAELGRERPRAATLLARRTGPAGILAAPPGKPARVAAPPWFAPRRGVGAALVAALLVAMVVTLAARRPDPVPPIASSLPAPAASPGAAPSPGPPRTLSEEEALTRIDGHARRLRELEASGGRPPDREKQVLAELASALDAYERTGTKRWTLWTGARSGLGLAAAIRTACNALTGSAEFASPGGAFARFLERNARPQAHNPLFWTSFGLWWMKRLQPSSLTEEIQRSRRTDGRILGYLGLGLVPAWDQGGDATVAAEAALQLTSARTIIAEPGDPRSSRHSTLWRLLHVHHAEELQLGSPPDSRPAPQMEELYSRLLEIHATGQWKTACKAYDRSRERWARSVPGRYLEGNPLRKSAGMTDGHVSASGEQDGKSPGPLPAAAGLGLEAKQLSRLLPQTRLLLSELDRIVASDRLVSAELSGRSLSRRIVSLSVRLRPEEFKEAGRPIFENVRRWLQARESRFGRQVDYWCSLAATQRYLKERREVQLSYMEAVEAAWHWPDDRPGESSRAADGLRLELLVTTLESLQDSARTAASRMDATHFRLMDQIGIRIGEASVEEGLLCLRSATISAMLAGLAERLPEDQGKSWRMASAATCRAWFLALACQRISVRPFPASDTAALACERLVSSTLRWLCTHALTDARKLAERCAREGVQDPGAMRARCRENLEWTDRLLARSGRAGPDASPR